MGKLGGMEELEWEKNQGRRTCYGGELKRELDERTSGRCLRRR